MTDTNTLTPTDAEIFALEVAHTKRHETRDCTGYFSEFDIVAFTLSAIAKWGAPALASQPFAYEFSRSNGDGTHSEHIERGRLQEVAPGRWEHSGLPRGALADKPIKALYTTPQTQPAAVPAGMEPVAHVSQETFNDDGTSDIIVPALPIGMALYAAPQPAAQAQHPDDAAVEKLAESMKQKLAEKRAQGRSGWDTDCTQQRLSDLLRQHVEKGDVLDVANFCAFLFARGESVSAAHAQEDVPDMFWDADDTENFAHEIQDIIDGYGPGEIVTIECARWLPSFRAVVTRDGDGISYEYLEAAIAAQQGEAT